MAELPLTVQLVSVVVPRMLHRPPPPYDGGVAADGAARQRGRPAEAVQATAVEGGVAADGAAGQRGRAAEVVQAAAIPGGRAAGDASAPRSTR